jgi:hypothetical protein
MLKPIYYLAAGVLIRVERHIPATKSEEKQRHPQKPVDRRPSIEKTSSLPHRKKDK